MVEVRPVLSGAFSSIPRIAESSAKAVTRAYDDDEVTNGKLGNQQRLPAGSTVWLIAADEANKSYTKKSYVVYNSDDDPNMSYLVPCSVDKDGNEIKTEGEQGTPLYLKDGSKYYFYVVSPARELDATEFSKGNIAFPVRNGESFYANDWRYEKTVPKEIEVKGNNSDAVQVVELNPMINQTALLRFKITKGFGVHDLDIQPAGIQLSGLQNDSPKGVPWHMSRHAGDDPIELKYGDKSGTYSQYNYYIDSNDDVNIDVPILPMYDISKPVIVIFRLKINGVPSSYEMMLNEKDFKAGYSYGYRGSVAIKEGVDVITWQYVLWETDVEFPFKK